MATLQAELARAEQARLELQGALQQGLGPESAEAKAAAEKK